MINPQEYFNKITLIGLLLMIPISSFGQEYSMKIMFWNFENLFNPSNDTPPGDDPFTPAGENHWTKTRLNQKLQKIAKTIIALGEGELPWIVGFCEAEDDSVINKLIRYTPLSLTKYQSVHYESKDPRGIDVGLLYRKDQLQLLSACPMAVKRLETTGKTYRDILYCLFDIQKKAKLIILVNHWPSRYGGRDFSEQGRLTCAERLNGLADSLSKEWSDAFIVAVGDFNDEPNDDSILKGLGANDVKNQTNEKWINLMYEFSEKRDCGTIKHQANWSTFDQILLYTANQQGWKSSPIIKGGGKVFSASFLLVDDKVWGGLKPFRTYQGPMYLGGFSDHLPVYCNLIIR